MQFSVEQYNRVVLIVHIHILRIISMFGTRVNLNRDFDEYTTYYAPYVYPQSIKSADTVFRIELKVDHHDLGY